MPIAYHGGESNTGAGLSAGIWGDFPSADEILRGQRTVVDFFLDFSRFRLSTNVNAVEAHWVNGVSVFGSDGAAIADGAEEGGTVAISSDGDNEGIAIRQSVCPFTLSADDARLWFEARLKTSTIADTKHGFFLGLMDTTACTAAIPITATGALADVNLVGFHRLEGDGDYVDTVYKADGVTAVTVKSDAQVLVANTYIKLGMKFDPDTDKLSFYVNGVALPDTKVLPDDTGTDFPADVRLGVVLSLLNATGTTPGSVEVDWIRCAQERTA